MSRYARILPAVCSLAFLFVTACGSEPATSSSSGGLRPGTAAHDAYPDNCTDQATCVGIPGVEQVYPEEVNVCKKYPAGVVGPAIRVKLDVITHTLPISSPTSLFYTIQPNSCLRLWYSNGGRAIPDTVTLQELLPGGYTSMTQIATGMNNSAGVFVSTPLGAPTSATTVNAITGGAGVPGILVVITNTPIPTASVGNFVWNDLDQDGVQDVGEPGIPGVTVMLSSGATTVTDANGSYLFSGLAAGTYTVSLTPPAGYTASPTGTGTPATDSNNGAGTSVTLTTGLDDTIDFGFYLPPRYSLGDRVWNDANGDGVQDFSEAGISGVTVTIAGPSGYSASMTTGANGIYSFSGLLAGTYTVCTSTIPAGFVQTYDLDGLATPNCATASVGPSRTDVDFGYRQPPPATGTLAGCAYVDLNGSGVRDVGLIGGGQYAIFVVNGGSLIMNSSHVTGSVAVGPGANAGTLQKTDISGQFVYDPTATWDKTNLNKDFKVAAGTVSMSLAAAQAAVNTASASYAAMSPTQTFGDITSTMTITGNGGVNVISVRSVDLNSRVLTLSGNANNTFIINVANGFQLADSKILLSGGVLASRVIFNFPTIGSTIDMYKATNVINGTFLAPYRAVIYHNPATFNGQIIAQSVAIHSDANLTSVPSSIPETCLAGATVQLLNTSTNATINTTSTMSGYSFASLAAATYTLTLTAVPAGYSAFAANPGTIGGNTVGSALGTNAIQGIALPVAGSGINYDFAVKKN